MLEVEFDLKPSKFFIGLFLILLVGSLILIGNLTVHWIVKLTLLFVTIGYLGHIIYRFGLLKHHQSIKKLLFSDDADFLYIPKERLAAKLLGHSIVTSFVSILCYQVGYKHFSTVIFPDSLSSHADYRRLLILLRLRRRS